MNTKYRAVTRVLTGSVAATIFVWTVNVAGQAPAPAAQTPSAKPAEASGNAYVAPKTPWGDPDIQGMFNFSYVMSVNLERCGGGGTGRAPADLVEKGRVAMEAVQAREEAEARARGEDAAAGRGGRGGGGGGGRTGGGGGGGRAGGGGRGTCDTSQAFITEEAYKQRLATYEKQQAAGDRFAKALKEGDLATALGGTVDPNYPQRQTSLVMDPPDGRLPPLTAEGNRQMMLMRSSWEWYSGELESEALVWDRPQDFDVWDRCITRGMPASMFPYRYNNGMQILQAPGYVILNLEMIHDSRIIPVDGRPRINSTIKQWLGESRGRWEGPQHAGHRDHQLQGGCVDGQLRHTRRSGR